MDRRTYVQSLGGVTTAIGIAGCMSRDTDRNGDSDDDTEPTPDPDPDSAEDVGDELDRSFRVATHRNIDVDETIWGWITEQFGEEYPDADPTWVVPDAGIAHYIERVRRDADVGADVFLGLTPTDLVRIDAELEPNELFLQIDLDYLEHVERIRDDMWVDDPHDRVIPFDMDYVGLSVSEGDVERPSTFDALTTSEYADSLLAQHPRQSRLGEAFLLWTVDQFGTDFDEFWSELSDNGVRIEPDRGHTHRAFAAGERPMVVSYATDTGLLDVETSNSEPPITYLDGGGYATPGSVAIFATTDDVDLAYRFVDFLLSGPVQRALAERQVRLPVISFGDVTDDPDDEPDEDAPEPDPDPVAEDDIDSDDIDSDDEFTNETTDANDDVVNGDADETGDEPDDNGDTDDDPDPDSDPPFDEDGFERALLEPSEIRTLSYDDISDSLEDWLDAWEAAVEE